MANVYLLPSILVLPSFYYGGELAGVLDPRGEGWQSLAVNQRQRYGTDYPFVNPDNDVRYLLGDLFLSYEDDSCAFALPFKIAWMYGFGYTETLPIDGFPSPTHAQDIIIHDANGQTVFDSTEASFTSTAWGTHLRTMEWVGDRGVLRATRHNSFPSWFYTSVVYSYIQPVNGELDARTYMRMPRRVRSIRVGSTRMSGHVKLVEGFNINLTKEETVPVDGGRYNQAFSIRGQPGDGLGRQTGCEDVEPEIRKINGVGPSAGGDFTIDAEACYWLRRPVNIVSESPRRASLSLPNLLTGGDDFGVDLTQLLPHSVVANTTLLRSLMENPGSALQILNDCAPCCSCDDYVATYLALKRVYGRYIGLGQRAEETRDQHQDNIARWTEQYACRLAKPLRLKVRPAFNCKLSVGGAHCNLTTCCVSPLIMRLTFEGFDNGEAAEFSTRLLCEQSKRSGTDTQYDDVDFIPYGGYPIYDVYFDTVDPQAVSQFRMLMQFASCTSAMATKVTLTVHTPVPLKDNGQPCTVVDPADVDIPSGVSALWASNPPPWPTRALIQRMVALDPRAGCGC